MTRPRAVIFQLPFSSIDESFVAIFSSSAKAQKRYHKIAHNQFHPQPFQGINYSYPNVWFCVKYRASIQWKRLVKHVKDESVILSRRMNK